MQTFVSDNKTSITFKPICDNCGHILKEFIYDSGISKDIDNGYKSEYKYTDWYFLPYTCPKCHKVIKEFQIPCFDKTGRLEYKESED